MWYVYLLYGISPYDSGVPVVVVGLVSGEVDFLEELLLMMLQLPHHGGRL
jgi:hypothetical protein